MPEYTGDNNAVNLLKKTGNSTIYKDGYLIHMNEE
jgi:hypothetical protein